MSTLPRLRALLRNTFVSACAAIGLLAIANVDAIHQEPESPAYHAASAVPPRPRLNDRLIAPKGALVPGVLADLRAALGAVELGRSNPFADLRDLKPLEAVLARGAVHFKRQSYRSAHYQEETGYDIVAFDITHSDQTKSTILAYLERTLEGPDVVPVVLLVTNGPERAKQALFRGGELAESQSVPLSVAQSMVAQRVNAGVPFFSVAR